MVVPTGLAGLTGSWNLLVQFIVFISTTGGELFALLEREGVFLEDAARLVQLPSISSEIKIIL